MLEDRIERLKLGFSIMAIGFLFWAVLVNQETHIQQYFVLSGAEKEVLGVTDEREESPVKRAIAKSEDFLILMQAGRQFLEQGKYELALATFKRTVELRPDYRDAHYLLGYTYLKLYEQTGDYIQDNPDPYTDLTNLELARLSLLRAQRLDPLSEKIPLLLESAGL
jgi:tetratricopeptide (TPR) repeat protein